MIWDARSWYTLQKEKNRPGDPEYDPRTVFIPNKAWATFSPFEKQFWEIKQNHFDTVLFFQKVRLVFALRRLKRNVGEASLRGAMFGLFWRAQGKFYELYENDAEIGHAEFDLKLTDRVKMKMVSLSLSE